MRFALSGGQAIPECCCARAVSNWNRLSCSFRLTKCYFSRQADLAALLRMSFEPEDVTFVAAWSVIFSQTHPANIVAVAQMVRAFFFVLMLDGQREFTLTMHLEPGT